MNIDDGRGSKQFRTDTRVRECTVVYTSSAARRASALRPSSRLRFDLPLLKFFHFVASPPDPRRGTPSAASPPTIMVSGKKEGYDANLDFGSRFCRATPAIYFADGSSANEALIGFERGHVRRQH
ncbi:hypothetical protein EVAR_3423_1 [Eumeta japonica]|uniref:Uncharacterized protein n=1 Tax=Eumeta variegata TaxID=151549 RepID=A0A4C1SSJ1_EUMVA|nr:hypothetical protein EVAR_3423_1 [Eumeta japonica]